LSPSKITVNSTKLIDNIFAAIKSDVSTALSSGILCKRLATSAGQLNVSSIMTPLAIKDMCNNTAVFVTAFIATPLIMTSGSPTGQPSSAPTIYRPIPKTSLLSQKMIGFLTIMCLIGVLRFIPSLIDVFSTKKVPKGGHLYNILVVLNAEEMAVLENIRHEDISFYRKMTVESADDSLNWQMNSTSKILEKHQEVKFFDVYDLLGSSGMDERDEISLDHSIKGNKVFTKEAYRHEAQLQTGMIIQVRPASDWEHNDSFDDLKSINSDADLESCRVSIVRLKGGGQSVSVLNQLPRCFIANTPPGMSSETDMDFRDMPALGSSYSDGMAHNLDSSLSRTGRDGKTRSSGAPSDSDSFSSCDSRAKTSATGRLSNSSLLYRHSTMRDARAFDDASDLDSTPRKSIISQDVTSFCTPRSMSGIAVAEEGSKWSPESIRSYNMNDVWVGEKWNWRDENDSEDAMEWRSKDKGREEKDFEGDNMSTYEEEKQDGDFDEVATEAKEG
jgi:hypothetical protein